MLPIHRQLLAVALMGLPSLAIAQDSVSKLLLPPGDAIDAYNPTEQVKDYIVDLSAFRSSWGLVYSAGPLIKASQNYDAAPPYFTHATSAQAISKDTLAGMPFARNGYMLWNGQGFGVNGDATRNDPGQTISTDNFVGSQFTAGFSEWGGGTVSLNNVIGAVVNYENDTPSRLYVSRVVSATNSMDYACDLSQFGFGGVEAGGNIALRADGYGSNDCNGQIAVTGNNYHRVDMLARTNGTGNVITNTGGSDATANTWLVQNDTQTHVPPTVARDGSGRAITLGTNFSNDFVYESAAGVASTSQAHMGPGVTSTRGAVAHNPANFSGLFGAGNVNGSCGMIGMDSNGGPSMLTLWGLAANGSVSGNKALTLPAVITDNSTGWPSNSLGAGPILFNNYYSQTAYRGGNGQVAVGADAAGNLLAAASVDHPTNSDSAHTTNLLAVARVDATSGASEWTIAAYCDGTSGQSGTGKPLLDGPGGNVVGRLVTMSDLTLGSVTGPSMSPPMLDSVGNIFFVGVVERFYTDGQGNPASDLGTGLVRAVYDEASFSYELELLFDTGTAFKGINSTTDYQVRFLDLADSNSLSSGTTFSGNIAAGAYNHADPANLPPASTEALGGLGVAAQIVYDVNGDGIFEPMTGSSGVPGSPDEDYRVLLYISSAKDCNNNSVPDDVDIASGNSTDTNANGVPDECDGSIGDNYCIGAPNSTGAGAVMAPTGSGSVSSNDVILTCLPVPTQQFGIFFYGSAQILAPFGNGFLCVGAGSTGLFRLPPTATGTVGILSRPLDVTSPPQAAGQINAGSTWFFQGWYRDPPAGGAFFNLSDGVAITFTP